MSTVPVPIATPIYGRDIEDTFNWLNMIVYGDFGVGKTFLAGSSVLVEDMRDILYIALEGGEKGLREVVKICKKNNIDANKHVMVIPVQSYKQYSFIYEFMKLHVGFRDAGDIVSLRKLEGQIRQFTADVLNDPKKMEDLIPEPKQFKTVITDSLTEAQKYCMYQLLGIDPAKQKLDAEPDAPQFSEWGRSREMIQFLVRRYRDLPVNSIFICGRDVEQDNFKKFHFYPMLPGKLSDDVRGLVDVVGYYDRIPQEGGHVVRRLYLEGGVFNGAYVAAKHRFGSSLKGLWVDNPMMATIHDLDNI
jgi:hypothetical protein